MAEALVSKVVEELAFLAAQSIQQEFSLVSGIQHRVENLRRTFRVIQAVLVDAEKRQITDESVRLWLDNLKELLYEMDAILDDWNTSITLRSNLKLSEKVLFYSRSWIHFNKVHRLGLRRRIACKIEELNEKLTNLSIEKERYTFSIQNVNSPVDRKTISSVTVSEVYGRDAEKDLVVRELLSESSQVGRGYDIIAILGTGGIGKTTLAQLIYNDERVQTHFNKKIWVCVSDPFDLATVARAILKALKDSNTYELVDLKELTNQIRKLIQGKKFFLVLDDVWTEDYRNWEPLEACLKNCALGSKILVITRNKRVAEMMGVKSHMIFSLGHISDHMCWSIFCKEAFVNKEDNKELEEIGKRIVTKCQGLPIVAKILGSLMRFKEYTNEEWMKVLNSELWQLEDQVKDKVFIPLLLSYYDLSPLEKRCFLYCSYFPKDYEINRDELIQLWLSQGFLSSKKDYMEEGVDCFKNLVARSFFQTHQEFEKDDNGNIIRCKMHDLVHDFLMFLTKNEFINTLINSKRERMDLENVKAFHWTLILKSEEAQIPSSIYNNKSLRTLSVRNLGYRTTIRMDLLLSLTCLRTLSLHDCGLKRLPKNIDKLIHLRYLSLCQPHLHIKLPKTICNLVNLHTLNLRNSVCALPKRIGKLINLQHLYVGDSFPTNLPKELGKLSSLQTLDCIGRISAESNASAKKVMTLEDLSKLNRLEGCLSIFIGKVKDVEEAERVQVVKNKEGLVELFLDLYGSETLEPRSKLVLLEGLEPNPNLKRLQIHRYYGTTSFPSWMAKLVNLKTLELFICPNYEVLGAFGKLPSLESLTIDYMNKVKRVGIEFLGIENCYEIESFPKLKLLEFCNLKNWEEWTESGLGNNNGDDDDSRSTIIMPSLVSLKIHGCPSLKPPLPAFLHKTTLQNLSISGCQHLEQLLEEGMNTEDGIKVLTTPTSESITDMTEATSSRNQVSPTNIDDSEEESTD